MKRRDFLRKTGIVAACGANLFTAGGPPETKGSDDNRREPLPDHSPKTLLVTSASSELAQAIVADLSADYLVRLTATSPVRTDREFVKCALDADESTNAIVRGADAIVHVARPLADVEERERIDYQTRCTYNLLQAAVGQGVRQVVALSSLRPMMGYEAVFQVDEKWRPLPTVTCGGLPGHLGEFVSREFAHEGKLNIIVLRVGNVARAETLKGQPMDPHWVDPRDAAQAVRRSLALLFANRQPGGGYWSIFHIGSDSPQSEFSIRKAERLLGYRPQYHR